MKYLPHGYITAPFQEYTKDVAKQVGSQHAGLDQVKGYRQKWISDNDGIAYKVWKPTATFEWAAVHMLVTDGTNWYEYIPLGHASEIFVNEGDFVSEGQVVGREGNHGLVFSGGRKITVEERIAGSRAGAHNHTGVRPIELVDEMESNGSHYLRDRGGMLYQHEGKYCKIKYADNGAKGWVNPLSFKAYGYNAVRLMAYNKQADNDHTQANILFAVANMIKAFTSNNS